MDCGVGGVTMGRFVWEYDDVTAGLSCFATLIHDGYSVKEAKATAGSDRKRQGLQQVLLIIHRLIVTGSSVPPHVICRRDIR
jgi:hypothetical protein